MFDGIKRIKEIKDKLNSMTFNKANENIKLFFDDYFRQQEIIELKLKQTMETDKKERHERILEYKNDLDFVADKFNEIYTEQNKIKLLKVMPSIFKKLGEMKKKYKLEDCNIDNYKI